MNELQLMALQKEIEKQLKEQEAELMKELTNGCEETDSTEVVCAKMISNSIAIATRISASAVFSILIDVGFAEPYSDDELRRKNLSIIKQQNI